MKKDKNLKIKDKKVLLILPNGFIIFLPFNFTPTAKLRTSRNLLKAYN
jgi:hypothetical protein